MPHFQSPEYMRSLAADLLAGADYLHDWFDRIESIKAMPPTKDDGDVVSGAHASPGLEET